MRYRQNQIQIKTATYHVTLMWSFTFQCGYSLKCGILLTCKRIILPSQANSSPNNTHIVQPVLPSTGSSLKNSSSLLSPFYLTPLEWLWRNKSIQRVLASWSISIARTLDREWSSAKILAVLTVELHPPSRRIIEGMCESLCNLKCLLIISLIIMSILCPWELQFT